MEIITILLSLVLGVAIMFLIIIYLEIIWKDFENLWKILVKLRIKISAYSYRKKMAIFIPLSIFILCCAYIFVFDHFVSKGTIKIKHPPSPFASFFLFGKKPGTYVSKETEEVYHSSPLREQCLICKFEAYVKEAEREAEAAKISARLRAEPAPRTK